MVSRLTFTMQGECFGGANAMLRAKCRENPKTALWSLCIAISMRCGIRRQMLLEVSQNIRIDVQVCALTFGDGVGSAGVHAHVKLLAQRDQFVHQQFESLEMHVVVS